MKCATSAVTTYLNAHPDVFMTIRPKEPSYFVERTQLREVYPAMERLGFWRGEEYYLKLFEDSGNARVIGEASANYARLRRVTGVAERIASFNRKANIVYIIRDPIERTISHYWYMVAHYGEWRSMLDAIHTEPDYCDTSYYAMQLQPYLELFGTDRVKVFTTEALRNDPVTVMHDLFRWLGVDPNFSVPDLGARVNVTPTTVHQPRGLGLLHRLRYSTIWNAVGHHVPASLRGALRQISEKKIDPRHIQVDEVVTYLRPMQQEQTIELKSLLGRDFPEWRTLYQQPQPFTRAR